GEIATICTALETFYTAYGRYPSNDEGLSILTKKTEKFPDPLLAQVPVDPWSRAYVYIQPGRGHAYEVICLGADGREGGEGADGMVLAVEQIRFADVQARERARRTGQEVHLRFDLERGGGVWMESSNSELIALPSGCRVTRIHCGGRAGRGREAAVTCSADGYTPSYAVLVETEDKERQQRWILFAGLT